jgi:hypothetical protein
MNIDFGNEAHQALVAEFFYDISNAFNIEHGQEYVLRALLSGDLWTARELAIGFDMYNAGISLIHIAIQKVPEVVDRSPHL